MVVKIVTPLTTTITSLLNSNFHTFLTLPVPLNHYGIILSMLLSIWLLTNVSQVDVIDVVSSLPHVGQVQGLASLHSPRHRWGEAAFPSAGQHVTARLVPYCCLT